MAWVEVILLKDEFREDEDGLALAKRNYYARSDVYVEADAALLATFGGTSIPPRIAAYSAARPYARVINRGVERLSPTQFNVTVDYEDPTDGSSVGSLLSQPARITTASVSMMEQYSIDRSSPPKVVMDTAGTPFDNLPERRASVLVYTIRKYVTTATRAAVLASLHAANSGAKLIEGFNHATWTLHLADAQFEKIDDAIYEAAIAIAFNPATWKEMVPSYGLYETGGGLISYRIKDDQGVPVVKPWPLLESGAKVPSKTGNAFQIEFRPYYESAWAGVPLS